MNYRNLKGKSKKGCLQFEYEIEFVDGYSGNLFTDVDIKNDGTFYNNIERADLHSAFTPLDKIESCSRGVCLDEETMESLDFRVITTGANFDANVDKIKIKIGDAEFEYPKDDELGNVFCSHCLFEWTSTTQTITPNCSNCSARRKLEFTPLSHDELEKEVQEKHANINGVLAKKDHVISKDSCLKAQEYMAEAWSEGLVSDENHHYKGNTQNHFEFFVDGNKLIEVIGKEDAKSLYDFFVESMGYKVPVTQIVFQHFDTRDQVSSSPFHTHDAPELVAFIRDEGDGVSGGGMAHISVDSGRKLHVIDNGSSAGTVFVQGPKVPHGMHSYTGNREVILFISDVDADPSQCLFKHIF